MSVTRTPPSSMNQAQSEPNISQSPSLTGLTNVNITNRASKRYRHTDSSDDEQPGVAADIKEILKAWKDEQEANLNRVLNEQSVHMSKLSTDLAELKIQNLSIQKSNLEIEKSLTFTNQQYEDMKKQIECLQKERKEYLHTIQELEKQVTDLRQTSRGSSIEIRNVPSSERESTTDLSQIVQNLGKVLGAPITGVRDIYRIPGKQGNIKPIVVELTSVQDKEKMLTSAKSYNKSRSREDRLNTREIPTYIRSRISAEFSQEAILLSKRIC
ncbi:hypothetical protein B5X24_HaOG214917 [Helicoverpa armigera]|nr:hypothetical protein B5X24_HaOG214917 [Helicoverpa armigera]